MHLEIGETFELEMRRLGTEEILQRKLVKSLAFGASVERDEACAREGKTFFFPAYHQDVVLIGPQWSPLSKRLQTPPKGKREP